jgi:hypothetical protein
LGLHKTGTAPGSFRRIKGPPILKNLPIIAKFMAIMAVFGLFSLGTAFYAAH